jgi:hypothetical protein
MYIYTYVHTHVRIYIHTYDTYIHLPLSLPHLALYCKHFEISISVAVSLRYEDSKLLVYEALSY